MAIDKAQIDKIRGHWESLARTADATAKWPIAPSWMMTLKDIQTLMSYIDEIEIERARSLGTMSIP